MGVEVAEIKKRRVTAKDWQTVEGYLSGELDRRKNCEFRKAHEAIWKEVDRQVAMKPMKRIVANKEVSDWHSTVELGELAKASEVLTADVRRMIFPHSRAWFDPHSDIPEPDAQKHIDGALRALMAQQHLDFGLKARFELSVKEALHHGSFVAEVKWQPRIQVSSGVKVENIAAPTWIPHSLWNCYPDPSPSVIGTDMFYSGSMIIVSFAPRHKVMEMAKGPGWFNLGEIPKRNKGEDDEILTYYGDLVIGRDNGEIFLPNSKAVTVNGKIIYYEPLELPFPPIIYAGYERLDVRDPYYTSPIVKLSPMQKLGSVMANKFIESVALKVEPPIVYDGSDPYFVQTGGPVIAPGAKSATKGTANWQELDIGDPASASAGLEMAIRQIQEGTGVNAIRAGGMSSDRQTATEVMKVSQAGEIRTVDFVDKLESQALRPFLYIQHELNKRNLTGYSFYNSEMDAPDFMRASKADLPDVVHFEVVGSKGLLGEEERTQKTSLVTTFASQNPLFAPLLNPVELLKEMYQDAGNKNPERFLVVQEGMDPQVAMLQQQAQQAIGQLQQRIQELESGAAIEAAKLQQDGQIKSAQAQQQAQISAEKLAIEREKAQEEIMLAREKLAADIALAREKAAAELMLSREIGNSDLEHRRETGMAELAMKRAAAGIPEDEDMDRQMMEALLAQQQAQFEAILEAQRAQAQALMEGIGVIAEQINRPKRLIRDQQGRPAGVETI